MHGLAATAGVRLWGIGYVTIAEMANSVRAAVTKKTSGAHAHKLGSAFAARSSRLGQTDWLSLCIGPLSQPEDRFVALIRI